MAKKTRKFYRLCSYDVLLEEIVRLNKVRTSRHATEAEVRIAERTMSEIAHEIKMRNLAMELKDLMEKTTTDTQD